MCGIVGITSTKEVTSRIIGSLKKLEYRGYDSAGIATISENNINEVKCEGRVNELEKCVILLQMFTFVGNDLYDENIKHYPGNCERSKSENFLIENASFIEY